MRQNFAYAFAETHNLNPEVRPMVIWKKTEPNG